MFFKAEKVRWTIYLLLQGFCCLKWVGNLSGILQLLLKGSGIIFILLVIILAFFWLLTVHWIDCNTIHYCTSDLFESICSYHNFKRTSYPGASDRHFTIWLFIQGLIPKMCKVILPEKSNRPSHYHRVISALLYLLFTDPSLGNSIFATFTKMVMLNLLA